MKEIKELINYFLQHLQVERNLSPNTIDAYSHDLKKFNDFLQINNYRITGLDSEKITAFVLFLKKKGVSSATIVRMLSSLRNFYRFIAGQGIIKNSAIPPIESPRTHRNLPEVLSKEEVTSILNNNNVLPPKTRARDLAVIEIIYGAGLRVSEVSGIKVADINLEQNSIKIRGKGNRERLVFFNKNSLYAVENYLAERAKNKKSSTSPYLFLNSKGERLSRQSIWKMVKKISALTGKNVSPHTFRHSFATHLLEGGLDLRIVQELLGHKSLATTEIYTHINKKQIQNIYRKYHPRS